jgi:hypothetical protein
MTTTEQTYTLGPSDVTKGEWRLTVPLVDSCGFTSRGSELARALGGRYVHALGSFFFTEAKARKWRTLYNSDFAAETVRTGTVERVKFTRHGVGRLNLDEAVRMARIIGAERKAEP